MERYCDFVIDGLTKSILELATGINFKTEIKPFENNDLKTILKKDGWYFNWKAEVKTEAHQVYKLTLSDSDFIQGLISLEPKLDLQFIELHLIENAPHNKGSMKKFVV